MRMLKFFNFNLLFFLFFFVFFNTSIKTEEEKIESIVDQIQIITQDLKTLEKAVYKNSDITSVSRSSDNLNEDVLSSSKDENLLTPKAANKAAPNAVLSRLAGLSIRKAPN